MPAPYFISPWVSVGPSSTTSTFLPCTSSGLSTVTGEAPMMMRAVGLTERTASSSASMPARSAESTLLSTTTSARRRLTSPG